MEAECEFLMYFPAAPISNLSDAAEYTTLPRRKTVYLGETVQFLLVLRSRVLTGRDDGSGTLPWKELGDSLSALASVCVAERRLHRPDEQLDPLSSCSEDGEEVKPGEGEHRTTEERGKRLGANHIFRQCNPLLSDKCSTSGEQQHESVQAKVKTTSEY